VVNTTAWSSVGFVLRRPHRDALFEPFFGEMVAGMDSVLANRRLHVLVQVVSNRDDEFASYERWSRDPRVVAVALADLSADDVRFRLLAEYGLPGVIIGEPADAAGMAVVRTDNSAAMDDAVQHLVALGHRTIGRISGPNSFVHTHARTEAFTEAVAQFGATGLHEEGDYSTASGAATTRSMLESGSRIRPTAIIYDNDVMAVAGLDVVRKMGLSVPGDISIVAWDDSTLCRLADPPLSAMSHDVHEIGSLAAKALLNVLDGGQPTDTTASVPIFVSRGSTGVIAEAYAAAAVRGAGAA
jgi:DNA-binding LacI/PurR family transcriptional regulator